MKKKEPKVKKENIKYIEKYKFNALLFIACIFLAIILCLIFYYNM